MVTYQVLGRKQPCKRKLLKFSAVDESRSYQISTLLRNLVCVYKTLPPKPNYHLKQTE